MGTRIAVGCAVLAVCAVVALFRPPDPVGPGAVLSLPQASPIAAAQERTEGSALPCDVPLAWRIARVDEEFGVSHAEAQAAIQQAAWVWEEGVGQSLFRYDSIGGFPIRLVYNARQARSRERRRRQAVLDSAQASLSAANEDLANSRTDLTRERDRLEARLRHLDQRVTEHNAVVARWNGGGGAPEERAREIQAEGDALDMERRELDDQARALERDIRSLNDQQRHLDRRIREHAQRAEEFQAAFPTTTSEWGYYREAIHGSGDQIESVSREIRIYQFETRDDLVWVVAHELGHALGLEHSATTSAVMSGERRRDGRSLGPAELTPTDVEALAALCPDLVAGAENE